MNGLNNFDETDREYSLAYADDLIWFWRSEVKVIAGLGMWWKRYQPRWCGVEAYLGASKVTFMFWSCVLWDNILTVNRCCAMK